MANEHGRSANGGDDNLALAQEVGRRSTAQLEASLVRLTSEAGAMSRWMLGALVLLNGGGAAVAIATRSALDPRSLEATTVLFVFGGALAVLAGLFGLLSTQLMARKIGEASSHWAQVAACGVITDDALASAGRVRRTGLFWTLFGLFLALVALLLFLAGSLTLTGALAPASALLDTPKAPQTNLAGSDNAAIPSIPANGVAQSIAPVQDRRTPDEQSDAVHPSTVATPKAETHDNMKKSTISRGKAKAEQAVARPAPQAAAQQSEAAPSASGPANP